MESLTNSQKMSVMRVLLDIIYADGKVDYRETALFRQLAHEMQLDDDSLQALDKKSAILSLLDVKSLSPAQKAEVAHLMDRTIRVDEDINVNEVAIYDVVIDFCKIPIPFGA